MKLLCIGKSGQVATALKERATVSEIDLIALGRPELDLRTLGSITKAVETRRPDIIINAAAYTHVDGAETDREAAFSINADGPKALAALCADRGIPRIHISTDYVFDGAGTAPFREADPTEPINVYGASQLAGETYVRAALRQHVILRTSWVYSPYGSNFVKTMLRLAKEKGEPSVVEDQIGCPTSALDIADAILTVSAEIHEKPRPALFGTFHYTASGEASWADVAAFVFDIYAEKTGCKIALNRIPSSDYPTPAARPLNSRLETRKITETFGITPRPWRESVRETVNRLMDEGS